MTVLDAQPLELATRLRPIATRLTLLLRREAPATELSHQQATVLATIAQSGPSRVTALAAATHVRQPSMTALLNRLEASGWVRRTPDPTDQRALLVELTDLGRTLVADAAASRVAVLADRLGGLTAEEVAAIARALPALERLVADPPPAAQNGHSEGSDRSARSGHPSGVVG